MSQHSLSDLQEVKKIVKSSLQDNDDQIASPWLPQSKSYLKIVEIPYLKEQSNRHILPEDIEIILKKNYIFNDIVLTQVGYGNNLDRHMEYSKQV